MIKRILALALAGCLAFESAPMTAYAAEPQTQTVSDNAVTVSEETDDVSAAETEAEVSSGEAVPEETQEILTEEVSTEEASTEELSTEEASVEEPSTEEVSTGEVSTEETSAEEETTVEETEESAQEGEETTSEAESTEEVASEEETSEEMTTEEAADQEAATEEASEEETVAETEEEALAEEDKTSTGSDKETRRLQSTNEELKVLNVGANTMTLPGTNGGSTTSVWYSFTAPESGIYYFYTENAEVSSNSYVYLYTNQTDYDQLGYGSLSSYSQLTLVSAHIEANQTIYVEAYTYATKTQEFSVNIEKIPEYSLSRQEDGSYTGETDKYTFSADLELGYWAFKGDIAIKAKSGQTLDSSYSLDIYDQKSGSSSKSSMTVTLYPEQNYTFSSNVTQGFGEYKIWFILKDYTTKKPLAVFDGNILLSTKTTEASYVIVEEPVVTENSVILGVEAAEYVTIYYAPVDGSAAEKSASAYAGYTQVTLSGLKPATEYYLEFVNSNKQVLGTEKVTTLATTTETVFSAEFTEGNEKLSIAADVSKYQGEASIAYLYYEYTDALGRKQSSYVSTYLSDIEAAEGAGKSFTISGNITSPSVTGSTDYELALWVVIDGVEHGREVKTVQSKAATVSENALSLTVSGNETGGAEYTAAAQDNSQTLQGYLYYKAEGEPDTAWRSRHITITSSAATGEITGLQQGVPYRFVLCIGGTTKEVTTTVGEAAVKLTPEGEAQINAFDFVRTFKVESTGEQELAEQYYLDIYYMDEDDTSWTSKDTIELNADNSYQAAYSTAAYVELTPDTEYRVKWTLTTENSSSAVPVATYYETIRTAKADLSLEVKTSYYDQQSYTVKLNPESISNFTNFSSLSVYAYLKKEGGLSWRRAASTTLYSSYEYSDTLTLSGLQPETTYHLSLRSTTSTPYTEYATLTFTTPADTRKLAVASVTTRPRSAEMSYTITLDRSSYVLLYIREKNTDSEWERVRSTSNSADNVQGTLTVSQYNNEALKPETTYEYKLGLGKDWSTEISVLEKVVSGEFTTQKDERKITAGASAGYASADISRQITGNNYGMSFYVYIFYREKTTPETTWKRNYADYVDGTSWSNTETITGLKSGTIYEYAVVISDDYSCNSPDEITDADLKAVGEFTTKTNNYNLKFETVESKLTYEKGVVLVTAEGSNDDDPVEVVLTLSGNDLEGNQTLQEQTISLKRGNNYTKEAVFTGLLGNTEYTITKAVFRVKENGQTLSIGEKAYTHKFTTPKAEVPTGIELKEYSMILNAAYSRGIDGYSSKTLEPTAVPGTAADDFVYETSDRNVATVSSTGTVTARGVGEADITVASRYDGSIKAVCKVTVKKYAIGYKQEDGSIDLLNSIVTLQMNKGSELEGYALYEVGTDNTPTLLPDAKVTPIKENIVTWENGRLKAENAGQTRVEFEQDGVKAAISVNVTVAGQGFAITGFTGRNSDLPAVDNGDGSYTLALGTTYTAVGEISPEQTFNARNFTWSISDDKVAQVAANGIVTPVAEGKATLTVEAAADTTYAGAKVTVDLYIKSAPVVEDNLQLYAITNVDTKIGDVDFPKEWGTDWAWEDPETPLVTNGVYYDNSYEFTALYTGDKNYPGKVTVQVWMGTITGVTAVERTNSHNHIIETGGEDSITLTLGISKYGKIEDGSYEFDIEVSPKNKAGNLTITKTAAAGVYTVTAKEAGKYTLKPVVKVDGEVITKISTGSYVLTAVADRQAATITVTSDTPGVTVSGNTTGGSTVSGNNIGEDTRRTIMIDTNQIKEGGTFKLTATVLDRTGTPVNTKLEWKTTDKSVAAIKVPNSKDTHNAEVTIKGYGHAVITAAAKDKLGRKVQLEVEIHNYEPRVSTKKASVNLAYDYDAYDGRQLAAAAGQIEIVPVYGQTISKTPQLLKRGSEEAETRLTLENTSGYLWLVKPANYDILTDYAKKETLQCDLKVETSEGITYTYPLDVEVSYKQPKVTARMSQKLNLFYTDTIAYFDLNISDKATLESVEWNDNDLNGANNGFSMYSYRYLKSNGAYGYRVGVSQQDRIKVVDRNLQDADKVARGTLSVTLYGYRQPCELENFEVKWQYKKPVLVTKASSTDISPELGQYQNRFYVYNKTDKGTLSYSTSMNQSRWYYNEAVCEDSEVVIEPLGSRIEYTYAGENPTNKITITLDSYFWRESLQVTHTIKAKALKAYLTTPSLTLNLNELSTLTTNFWLTNGYSIAYRDIVIQGADAKAQNLLSEDLFILTAEGNTVTLKPSDPAIVGKSIPKGNYKYKVTPYYTSPKTGEKMALNTMTLTIKVVDKPVTAKVSPSGSIDLANGTRYTMKTKTNCSWVDPKFSNLPSGYSLNSITKYELVGEYSAYFKLGYEGATFGNKYVYHYYLTVSEEGSGKLKAGQNYRLAIKYTLENAAGETITVTSNTFNIKPKQSKPKVTVTNNNQTLYAAAEYVSRTYYLTVPSGYSIRSASGSLDCNKDGVADIVVSGASSLTVRITDRDAVITNSKNGKTYTIPVTVKVVGRDGISKDATVNIKVTVKR